MMNFKDIAGRIGKAFTSYAEGDKPDPKLQTSPSVHHEQDPHSMRRWFNAQLAQVINPENKVLFKERTEDLWYAYPYGLMDMMLQKDLHIAALVNVRKQAVLDSERIIQPADESREAEDLAQFVEWALDMIGYERGLDWTGVVSAMLDAVFYGFRVCELVWEPLEYTLGGSGQTVWLPTNVIPRRHRRFTFDEHDELRLVVDQNKIVEAPQDKFFLSVMYPDHDSPWGDPLGARLYYMYLIKSAVYIWFSAYCERFGHPIPWARTKDGKTANDEQATEMKSALAGLQSDMYLFSESDIFEVDMLSVSHGDAKTMYLDFINQINREMTKLYAGATMVVEESKTGTQAMAGVLEGRFLSKVQADARAVSRMMLRLLRQIIRVNYDDVTAYRLCPKFSLEVTEEKDLKAEAEIATKITSIKGVQIQAGEFYDRFGYSLPEGMNPEDLIGGGDDAQGDDDDDDPKPPNKPGKPGAKDKQAKDDPVGQYAEGSSYTTRQIAQRADTDRDRVLSDDHIRQAIRDGADNLLDVFRDRMRLIGDLREAIAKPFWIPRESAGFQDFAKGLAALNKTAYLRGLLLNSGNLGLVGKPGVRQFREGSGFVTEVDNLERFRFAEAEAQFDSLSSVINRVEELEILTKEEFLEVDDWVKSVSYTAAGQTTATLEASMQPLLFDIIENGGTMADAIEAVQPSWATLAKDLGKDEVFLREAHLENVIRTNGMRAYNQGWNDVAFAPGMAQSFPCAEFSAIIDTRTTECCSMLDGKLIPRDQVGDLTPPLHYLCRSILVWIHRHELKHYTADSYVTVKDVRSWPVEQQPMPGFGKYTPLFGNAPDSAA